MMTVNNNNNNNMNVAIPIGNVAAYTIPMDMATYQFGSLVDIKLQAQGIDAEKLSNYGIMINGIWDDIARQVSTMKYYGMANALVIPLIFQYEKNHRLRKNFLTAEKETNDYLEMINKELLENGVQLKLVKTPSQSVLYTRKKNKPRCQDLIHQAYSLQITIV